MNKFEEIFSKYPETDKIAAGYHIAYEEVFGHIRNDIKLLFEIGVNKGGSVRGWEEYFPNALIVGLEIDPKWYFEDDRIKIEIMDATDGQYILNAIDKYGVPDILIDDGSHFAKDIWRSFEEFYIYNIKYYVIEDLITQDKNFYVGDCEPATNIFLKRIEDMFFSGSWDCKCIKIYPRIGFIER